MKGIFNLQLARTTKSRGIKRNKDHIYNKVDNRKRLQLLRMVKEGHRSLKEASKCLGINYSTAKTILRVYRIENRILKKTASPSISQSIGVNSNEEAMKNSSESTIETSYSSTLSPSSKYFINSNTVSSNYSTQLLTLTNLTQEYLNELLYSDIILNSISLQFSYLFTVLNSYTTNTNTI